MRYYRRSLIILLTIIGVTLTLRWGAIAGKQLLTHDEGVSYLAATCHLRSYAQAIEGPLMGRWVPAAEWKELIRPETVFCFSQIGTDLAHRDIHPPLYFWLLHLWLLVFEVNLQSGAWLNIGAAGLTALALFGLAWDVLGDEGEAILVLFTWAFNPAIIFISAEARPYDLFTLWTVLGVWQTIRAARPEKPPEPRRLLLLAGLMTAGLLTHYYFLWVIAGCLVFAAARLLPQNSRHLVGIILAFLTGGLLALALHPQFYLSFQGYNQQSPFVREDFFKRVQEVRLSFRIFSYVFAPFLGVVVWRALHAFLPVFVVRLTGRLKPYFLLLFYIYPVLLTITAFVGLSNERRWSVSPLVEADHVLIDNSARGILPRIIIHTADDSLIYVDTQKNLVHQPDRWLTSLTDRSVYVSHLAYGNAIEQTKTILALIEQDEPVTVIEQGIWDIGYIIKINSPHRDDS